ncbi:hypothetical protein ACP70R_036576 [Stipagrostis hirtigluma subsp. patula]
MAEVPRNKRKRVGEEECSLMRDMTAAVREMAHAMQQPVHNEVHEDLYHAVMNTGGFTQEALMYALSHLLDNKPQGLCFVQMTEEHRVLWLRTFLGKHYYN